MIYEGDKKIVRDLAKKYMELISSEKQLKGRLRARNTNDLIAVRPPVILDEIPWYQMDIDGELELRCTDGWARNVERHFRRCLFYIKHFRADNNFEPFFRVKKTVDSTGIGIEMKTADLKRTDETNNIVSREFEDVLENESALELLHDPEFTLRPEIDEHNMAFYNELLGDSIPIKLYGFDYYYDAPWDKITRLRGVEPILFDMYDRPEYLHAIMDKFVSASNAWLDFVEKNLDVDPDITNLHCTPATVSKKESSGLKATWYRGMAQTLGTISPQMFEEFEIDHVKPVAERFGFAYYGCCEPLDNKIEVIKKISNLRKIGCSPWANVNAMAEQIGGDFVLARKPNPAFVAHKTDPEVIRRETEETVKACLKYGCPYELVLKDISTVSNNPQNLIVWSQTVSEVLDEYYGKE